jgi:phosphoglycolate phosphatase
MNFDGIILDIDGTIWNTTAIVADAWNKVIKNYEYILETITPNILKMEFGKTMDTIADDLFPSIKGQKRKILLEKCCAEEQLAIKLNTKKIEYDGVVESIKRISSAHKVYIVSNCQKGYIELVMSKTGITQYISDYECFGNTGRNKAANIVTIIQRNNILDPVYVGDTQGDCDACKEASIPFIWASYGFGKADSYYAVIKSFSEIENIL